MKMTALGRVQLENILIEIYHEKKSLNEIVRKCLFCSFSGVITLGLGLSFVISWSEKLPSKNQF